MHPALSPMMLAPILAVEEAGADSAANANWGQVVLILAASAMLVWVMYLVISSRSDAAATPEETPKNLQPYLSDDDLENNRLTRVLGAAVIAAAVLAISLPVYYVGESRRQAAAAEKFHEKDIEEGEKWYTGLFQCVNCHSPEGVGGGAAFIEPRSGLTTSWSAPSLNDVLYRYSEAEVEYWLNYGRSGTPMPVVGLVGGGAATTQEVEQLIAYLRSIQIPQAEAVAKVDSLVPQALSRLTNADVAVSQLIRGQQGVIDDILDAPDQFDAVGTFPAAIRGLMAADGTCTDKSAASVGKACEQAGADSDRDGLADELELLVAGPDNEFAAVVAATVAVRSVEATDALAEFDVDGNAVYQAALVPDADYPALYNLSLSPLNAFTMADTSGEPIADFDAVTTFLTDLDTAVLNLGVTTDRNDLFLANAAGSYQFLVDAYAARAWVPPGVSLEVVDTTDDNGDPKTAVTVDFTGLADGMGAEFTTADAERAVGLFNANCARCHTAGYSAGAAYEQGAGSGAWGPALTDGRSVVQFPDAEDQVTFIIGGSNLAEKYGVNGIGRGWMPGFGQVLTEEDIRLIVAYERSL